MKGRMCCKPKTSVQLIRCFVTSLKTEVVWHFRDPYEEM